MWLYTPTDSLILDLNGDDVRLTNYGRATLFYSTSTTIVAAKNKRAGLAHKQDGIVVYDLNNDKIDDMSEIFSEYFNGTVGSNGNTGSKPFANGLAALKSLDSKNDNQFTSSDTA